MQKKFLKDAVSLVVGKQSEKIAELIDSPKHVNEFIIAKKMEITINQTRNLLYKLSDNGLVSSIRKKDKKKGWYTYFWKIETLKSLEFLMKILEKRIEQINNQIKSRETKQFYICEECNIEFNEENALLHNFTCNECGGIFKAKDNSKLLREFKRNLDKLKKEVELIEEEIKKEKEKDEKIRLRVFKKEEKEAAKKKAEMLAKRRAAKKILKEESMKKTVKKKPAKKKIVAKKRKKEKKKVLKKASVKKTLKKKTAVKKAKIKKSAKKK